MPPRKRARHSTATTIRKSTTPQREPQPKSKSETPPPSILPLRYSAYAESLSNAQNDPWTDEEETLLFKSLVKWKPTGLHKHFRMLAIFESFRSHGYSSSSRGPPPHLRIPGIWAKLYTLYDLDALDQRENAHAGLSGDSSSNESDEEDAVENEEEDDDEGSKVPKEFKLPGLEDEDGDEDGDVDMDFGEMLWKARLAGGSDEAFDEPEIVKGLSATRSLPGAKLNALEAEVDTKAEEGEENDEEEASAEESEGEEEDEEEEGEGEEENEAEDEEEDEEEEEEAEEESVEEEEEITKPAKKTAKTPAKRGRAKTSKTEPPPKRRAPRRRG